MPLRVGTNLARRRKRPSLGNLDVLSVEIIQKIIPRIDLFKSQIYVDSIRELECELSMKHGLGSTSTRM